MGDTRMMRSPSRLADAAEGRDYRGVCNRLVEVLRDAAHGWRIAADAVGDDPLGDEMRHLASRREEFAVEMANVVAGRSGDVSAGGTAKGQLFAWWLKARAALTRGDRDAVVAVCRAGSEAAVDEYDKALEADLPDPIRNMIVRQANEVRETAAWLRNLE